MKDRYYLYVWHADAEGQYAYCRPYDTIGECRKVVEQIQHDDYWAYDWSVWDRKEHHYVTFGKN